MLENHLDFLTEEFQRLCSLLVSEAKNRAQSLSPLKSPTKRKIKEISRNVVNVCSEDETYRY